MARAGLLAPLGLAGSVGQSYVDSSVYSFTKYVSPVRRETCVRQPSGSDSALVGADMCTPRADPMRGWRFPSRTRLLGAYRDAYLAGPAYIVGLDPAAAPPSPPSPPSSSKKPSSAPSEAGCSGTARQACALRGWTSPTAEFARPLSALPATIPRRDD